MFLYYQGWDVEHSEFMDFVKRLQKGINAEGSSTGGDTHNASSDEFTLHLGDSIAVKSYLFFTDQFTRSQLKTINGSVENFQGAFLTIHELQACSDKVRAHKIICPAYQVNESAQALATYKKILIRTNSS